MDGLIGGRFFQISRRPRRRSSQNLWLYIDGTGDPAINRSPTIFDRRSLQAATSLVINYRHWRNCVNAIRCLR
jgi:hypothetical protein